MSKIARFEALAERLVEGTFARLFAGRLSPLEVATHLTRAMEDHQVVSPEGTPQAPTHYWVHLHPDNCDALAIEQPALEEELAHHVTELAAQAGLALEVTPVVHVLPDEGIGPHEVHVEARWMPEEVPETEKTREMEASGGEARAAAEMLPLGRPFLILATCFTTWEVQAARRSTAIRSKNACFTPGTLSPSPVSRLSTARTPLPPFHYQAAKIPRRSLPRR